MNNSGNKQHANEDTTLTIYLQEIGKTDLLTQEEECDLARKIREGDMDALDRLVKANLRFVVTVAKQYQHRGLSLADMISEGNIGLMKAARRFDETKGFKFISYAVWWIRQAITSAMGKQARLIRLPLNKVDELHKLKLENRERENMLGNDEIPAEDMEAPQPMPDWAAIPTSLDAPISGYENLSPMDFLKDQNVVSPDDSTMENALKEEIERSIASLSPRESEILNLYFGLDSNRSYTLDEIGKRFGLTRERIRQIKQKAINKLRHSSRSRRLAPYAE